MNIIVNISNIKKLEFINKKIYTGPLKLSLGDVVCIAPSDTITRTGNNFVKLVESNNSYYFLKCDMEGIIEGIDLSLEYSLDKWSNNDLIDLLVA